jgi:hypothetical protein
MNDMQLLCEKLEVTIEELPRVPPQLVELGIQELNLPLGRRTRLTLELGDLAASRTRTDASVLARHFERQQEQEREPWRAELERVLALVERASNACDEAIEESFVDAAKCGLLDEASALAGAYLVFGGDGARRFFCSIMMLPREEMIRYHNFYVAHQSGPEFLQTVGKQLCNITVPLYPPLPSLRALNLKVVQAAGRGVPSGGGVTELYRRPVEGAGVLPVVPYMDGYGVDMAPVEEAFGALRAAVLGRGRGGSQGRGGRGRGEGARRCFKCNAVGHLARACTAFGPIPAPKNE